MSDLRELEAMALEAQKQGQYDRAIEFWSQLLGEAPSWESGYAHYYLADCYLRSGQVALAEKAYREAISISPGDTLFSDALTSLQDAKRAGYV